MLQWLPNSAPMQYNTALCMALSGLGLVLLTTFLYRLSLICAFLVALVGSLTLAEYIARVNLGIDQLLFTPYFEAASAYYGRMSPLAAGCFVVLGGTIALLGTRRRYPAFAGLLACVVIVVSLTALAGYTFGINAAYGWGAYSAMAINTALVFLLLGTGLLVLASNFSEAENQTFVHWLPVSGSITLMLMIAFVAAMNRADMRSATGLRRHTIKVILAGQAFEENMVGIQRGLRGYVTLGDRAAFASYRTGVALEPELFKRLIDLTVDNSSQRPRLDRLEAAMAATFGYDRRALAAYDSGGTAAFMRMDALGESRSLTGETREALREFSMEEQRLLDLRETAEENQSLQGTRLSVFGSVLAAVLLVLATNATRREMARRRRVEVERERLISELQQALGDVKTLTGMIPICGWCKSIRSDTGFWQSVEHYVCTHTDATFTHGICPECLVKFKAGEEMPSSPRGAIKVPSEEPSLPAIEIRTLQDS
jgi:CHASE3 domain sensor protein